MNWYLAKIIFRIVCGEGDHTPQFDEQLRLVLAENNEQALNKAYAMGRQEADCFMNQRQKMVEWQFIDVTELYRISELIDGAELYSRIQEADNAETYMELMHQRAAFIRQNHSHSCLQLL
jgi:Domain of unknown function (DUF4288)